MCLDIIHAYSYSKITEPNSTQKANASDSVNLKRNASNKR